MDHQILHSESNPSPQVQASDGLVSSDMESGALTAKQINAEVSEQIWSNDAIKPHEKSGQSRFPTKSWQPVQALRKVPPFMVRPT